MFLPTGYGLLIPFKLKWSKLTLLIASHGSLLLKALSLHLSRKLIAFVRKAGCNPCSELEVSLVERNLDHKNSSGTSGRESLDSGFRLHHAIW